VTELPTVGQSFVTKHPIYSYPSYSAGYVKDISDDGEFWIVLNGSRFVLCEKAMRWLLTEDAPVVDRIRACIAKYKARL
jgi:hypothetical protein